MSPHVSVQLLKLEIFCRSPKSRRRLPMPSPIVFGLGGYLFT